MSELTRKGERTREQLLDAARRVIARKGLLAATIVDFAEEADRAPATIYLYFPSKLELAYELARQFDSYATAPAPSDPAHPRNARDNIALAVEQFWQTFAEQLPTVVGAVQLAMVEPAFAEEWAAIRRTVTQRFTRAIQRLQEHDARPSETVPLASAISAMLFHSAIVEQYLDGSGKKRRADPRMVDTLAEVWFRAVTSSPASWQ